MEPIATTPTRLPMRPAGLAVMLIAASMAIGASACTEKPADRTPQQLAWLHNPEHGLARSTRGSDVGMTVKFLPADYRAGRELRALEGISADSAQAIRRQYEATTAFVVRVEKVAGAARDTGGFSAQADRFVAGMQASAALDIGGKQYQAVLAVPDVAMNGETSRTLTVVFPIGERELAESHEDSVRLTVDASQLGLGTQTYRYATEAIRQARTQ